MNPAQGEKVIMKGNSMKKYKRTFTHPRLFLTAAILVSLVFWGITAWSYSLKKSNQQLTWEERKENLRLDKIKVKNYTSNLTIVSTEIDKKNDSVTVVLRNDYKKPVTGYIVTIGSGTVQTECLTGSDNSNILQPGDVRKEIYGLQLDIDKLGIKVAAVILDDRTTDGQPQFVEQIQQYRLGMKIQRQYALDFLRKMTGLPENELTLSLSDLESRLPHLSESEESKLSTDARFGLQDEKVRLIGNIKRLKERFGTIHTQGVNKKETFQGKLTDLIDNYIKMMESL